MSSSSNNPSKILIILCLSFLFISSSIAKTPPPPFDPYVSSSLNTFDFKNVGPFSPYLQGEYSSTYRELKMSASSFVMSLCFYNTTPNTYTLALGTTPQHWVWSANPTDPVREGAILSFKDDGNLILIDFDGRLVWQTNTSSMGVVGIETPIYDRYGNLVLYDGNNNPVWQSFDHPTDTLFANQFLRVKSPKKLVSRVSSLGGYHSLVLMPNKVSLFYKSANSAKPLVYYTMFKTKKTLDTVQFLAYNEYKPSFNQHFTDGTETRFEITDLTPPSDYHYDILASFIRLENNGNLKVYIYQKSEENEDWFQGYGVFALYGEYYRTQQVDSCLLPERCGKFGVCENGSCVSCPSAKGMVPWAAETCQPPKLGACSSGVTGKYYRVQGVEHFSCKNNKGEGPMVLGLCQVKCNLDCKCVGYFYHQENSMCWITYDLMTLTKSNNAKHFGFIKVSN